MRMTTAYAVCWLCGLATAMERWDGEIMLISAAVFSLIAGRCLLRGAYKQLGICAMAMLLALLYGHWQAQTNISSLPEHAVMTLSGTIKSTPRLDGDRLRFDLAVEQAEGEKIAVTIKLADQREALLGGQWQRGDHASLTGELAVASGARNFGQFDYAKYLHRREMHRVFTVDGIEEASYMPAAGLSLNRALGWVESYRARLAQRVEQLYPESQSGFMQGMLIGVRADMPHNLFDQFSRLGLTHIIAISGLHVAIVIGGFLLLLRLMRVTRENALFAVQFLIPAYVLLSGASPSVMRAGIMAGIAVYAARKGWLKDAMQLLALAIIIMTVWQPFYIYDVGFQLSFAVTAGLIGGTTSMRALLPSRPGWFYNALSVTVVAQLISFPLTIYYFNQFSLLSAFANLVLVPVFSFVVLPGGYVSLLLSYVYLPLGGAVAAVMDWCNRICFWFIAQLDGMVGALVIWKSPSIGMIMLYYALLYLLAGGIQKLKTDPLGLFPRDLRLAKRVLTGAAAMLVLWLTFNYYAAIGIPGGSMAFLDVGQGDAILIRTPSGRTILIDGGGTLRFQKSGEEWRERSDPYEVGKDLLVPLLKKRGIRQIDYLIVTHADADHIGGLPAVLAHIPVKRLLFNGTLKDSAPAQLLFQTALDQRIPLYAVTAGERLQADKHTQLEFLYPLPTTGVPYISDQNSASTVFLLHMYDKRFLFTGDMDATAERRLMAELAHKEGARVDVLKVAHHGSKSSTTERWLQFWQPRLAVISVGARNVYRHPSPVVIDRLDAGDIPTLRTDLHGEIQLRVEGGKQLQYRVMLESGGL